MPPVYACAHVHASAHVHTKRQACPHRAAGRWTPPATRRRRPSLGPRRAVFWRPTPLLRCARPICRWRSGAFWSTPAQQVVVRKGWCAVSATHTTRAAPSSNGPLHWARRASGGQNAARVQRTGLPIAGSAARSGSAWSVESSAQHAGAVGQRWVGRAEGYTRQHGARARARACVRTVAPRCPTSSGRRRRC